MKSIWLVIPCFFNPLFGEPHPLECHVVFEWPHKNTRGVKNEHFEVMSRVLDDFDMEYVEEL